MNAVPAVSCIAGVLIFAWFPIVAAMLNDAAPVQSAGPVRVAQAENEARYDNTRPVTLGDLYRFEDRQNARMDRLEDKIDLQVARLDARLDTILTLLVGVLVAIIAALLGLIAVLLPRNASSAQLAGAIRGH